MRRLVCVRRHPWAFQLLEVSVISTTQYHGVCIYEWEESLKWGKLFNEADASVLMRSLWQSMLQECCNGNIHYATIEYRKLFGPEHLERVDAALGVILAGTVLGE